ncbi:DUF4232 domain-containing protein [Pseudonocardia endophytica]|uniref:Uncharacterized protein DUF4232 n=1 Tax=Pseudonocardia endophytica TaxID=401976 RepID=A0A4V2PHY1_PSEEN|nr:DUF4232 domain-containing protein [Pseudonocardia endophytica]TCK22376.1 uncharacterized protein DUF4232 [Pseudonocardia endophytica]
MARTRWDLVAAVLAAGVALTACAGGSDWPQGSVPAASPTSGAAAPPTGSAAPTSEAATSPAADAGGKCRLDDLRASVGATTGGSQRRTAVVWTNSSDRACTMTGFGGVDLAGPNDPMGPVFSLRRQEAAAEPVRLAPGGTAHTTITWLSDGGWTPTTIRATPPDETRSASLAWPGGPVLRQDGATRPGTYISPVTAGSG